MSRPVIGVIANSHLLNDTYAVQAVGDMNLEAIAAVCDALPIIVPALPDIVALPDLMNSFDGFIFPGGRPNVHPEEYGEEPTPAHGEFDRARDRLALPLIRACVEAGLPILGICRGFQEMNVAFGGSLYPEIRDLPGRDNHRMPPDGTIAEKFAMRHTISFTPGGVFHRLMGAEQVVTNSLHGQGIKTPGSRVVIEGWAPDQTPEAVHIADAPGFALGVQWHPEYQAGIDPVSRPLFAAFGDAATNWANGKRSPVRQIA
ncbi:putative glutamine amidotransferase [Loktanella sp. DSM 29012]|uniref:gamma-glutamyl-gamma-aminobutyrate hydrolase family protein n=1 Tax=Loktanella sp. DSM 29012 TaxID=1881056 RepID=UPI0008B942CA|nr:gamma-glutamyl-gamma-aminobutyrate hydrolase family protein [Loktanella sp. DSM 29012]SEP94497.1 putative glutamine amidotransferase [Loktanella sp. DSM 29012]